MEITVTILAHAVPYLIRTFFLLLALWLMVKIQKFQYNFPGLLGSAALASALDMIPYFGHFLAVPVLYICLLKVTREDLTGVVFTAGISYALVFAMNLFVLGSLTGSLRISALQQTDKDPVTMDADDPAARDADSDEIVDGNQPSNSNSVPARS